MVSPEIEPDFFCILVSSSFFCLKRASSSSSLQKARITRIPVRFSLAVRRTSSSFACTDFIIGIFRYMMPKTTIDNRMIAPTKLSAALKSIVNAMIMAPNTTNGERRNSLSAILTPFCSRLISLVIRVIIVEVPIVSTSEKERPCRWENRACLSFVAKPTAALALKYCAVTAQVSPMRASKNRSRHIRMT